MELPKSLCETRCLFCLSEFAPYIVAYTTEGGGEGGSGDRVEFTTVITPKLENVCTYLGVKLVAQNFRREVRDRTRKRKIVKVANNDDTDKVEGGGAGDKGQSESKESIYRASSEKLLCLPCFEKVNHLRILHEQLKDIKQRIMELTSNVKRIILEPENCLDGVIGNVVSSGETLGLERNFSEFSRAFGDHVQKVTEMSSTWIVETNVTDLLFEIKQEVGEEDKPIEENDGFTSPPDSVEQNLPECHMISDVDNGCIETDGETEGADDPLKIEEKAATRKLLVIAANICSRDTNSKSSSHTDVPPIVCKQVFQCPHCTKCYASLKSLGLHLAAQHARNKKKAKEFGSRFTLGDKTKIEEDGKTLFQCPNCFKKYEKVKALRNHIARNHVKQKTVTPVVTCNICTCTPARTFQTQERLQRHIFSAHTAGAKFRCPECDKGFHSNQARNQHVDSEHKGVRYKCSLCPKYFRHSNMLKRHIIGAHRNEKLHECHICAKNFAMANDLTRHMVVHDDTASKDHICDQCGKQFLTRSRLASHISAMHTLTEKQLACSHCKKLFKKQFNLERHLLVHSAKKPFPCTICKRPFTQKASMEIHLKTHNAERNLQKRGRKVKTATCDKEVMETDGD